MINSMIEFFFSSFKIIDLRCSLITRTAKALTEDHLMVTKKQFTITPDPSIIELSPITINCQAIGNRYLI